MDKWHARWYGFTGLFITFGIWTPLIWFVSSARSHYKMESFEVLSMDWVNITIFFVLCVATLVAQFGLMSIARDLSEFEQIKKNEFQ